MRGDATMLFGGTLSAGQGEAWTVLDALWFGIIVCDGSGRVLWVNEAGGQFITGAKWLSISQGHLRTVQQRHQDELNRLLASATANPRGIGGSVHVKDGCGPGYMLSVMPIRLRRTASGHLPPVMALILTADLAKTRSPPGRHLSDCFGLTPAEARLTVELSSGKTLGEIARDRNVSDATLRTQLRAALSKTDTVRQVDLVRLLVGLPASHIEL